MTGRLLIASGVFASVALSVMGCPAADNGVAGTSDAGSTVALGDAATGRADAPTDEPEPIPPEGLPPGWVRWDGAGKMCKFYVPASPENLPKALHWVDCPQGGSLPTGSVCKLLDVDWTSKGLRGLISWMHRSVDDHGTVRYAIGREEGGFYRREVIRDDGTVEHAILEGDRSFCAFYPTDFRGARYAYGWKGTEGSGIVSGLASVRLPDQVVRRSFTESHEPYVTPFGLLDVGPGHVLSLLTPGADAMSGKIWSAAQDNGLQQALVVATDNAVFWMASSALRGEMRVYTPEAGVRAMRSFGSDVSRRDFDVGTDGQDLVWIHASERAQPFGLYPKLEVLAAPYTTNPALLAPRRVRAFRGSVGAESTLVGCGFALHGEGTSSTLIRLSDGRSWSIPAEAVSAGIQWSKPLAVTCDEIFGFSVLADRPTRPRTLVRVRIDSLGPGTPAD